jgi:hypothetical protein
VDPVVLLVGAVILAAVGAWTVTHPNGGYRAAGGLGSSCSPGTRRAAGFLLIAVAIVLAAVAS